MSSTDLKPSTTPASLPEQARRLALFGPPPLLEGEDTASYDELLVRISGAVKPAEIFEEIWIRDIVDLVWEAFRLRRLKANLMTVVAYQGLERILEPLLGWSDASDLAKAWAARDRTAIKQVEKLLASAGLTMDAVMAQTIFQIERHRAHRSNDRHRRRTSQRHSARSRPASDDMGAEPPSGRAANRLGRDQGH